MIQFIFNVYTEKREEFFSPILVPTKQISDVWFLSLMILRMLKKIKSGHLTTITFLLKLKSFFFINWKMKRENELHSRLSIFEFIFFYFNIF